MSKRLGYKHFEIIRAGSYVSHISVPRRTRTRELCICKLTSLGQEEGNHFHLKPLLARRVSCCLGTMSEWLMTLLETYPVLHHGFLDDRVTLRPRADCTRLQTYLHPVNADPDWPTRPCIPFFSFPCSFIILHTFIARFPLLYSHPQTITVPIFSCFYCIIILSLSFLVAFSPSPSLSFYLFINLFIHSFYSLCLLD
jgi:hypothetical protein